MFPLVHVVEIAEVGEQTDYFGDTVSQVTGEFQPVKVAGWAVNAVEEEQGDSVLRTIDQLTVYAPETVPAGSQVRLPDGSVWEVRGNSEDYNHGPWWVPGLFVVNATKVEG